MSLNNQPCMTPANIRLDEDVFRLRVQKTSSRRLQDVFKTSWSRRTYSLYSYVFRRRLQDVLKTSWSRPIYSSCSYVFKTSSRRLQEVLPRCLQNVFQTSSRRLAKTSSRHLQDAFDTFWRSLQDVFKTSSRRLAKVSSRRFQDVSSSYTVLVNKFSRCLQDVLTTFLRRTANTVIYRRICLGHTSKKFMVSAENLQGWQQFLKF